MTQPTNTFDAHEAIGIREDLSDVIYNISPTDCPFMQSIGRATAENTKHEWQTDSLATHTTSNAVIEGDEATLDSVSPTARVNNYTQISDKTAVITGTLEAVRKAGRTREMAYQVAKKTKELKRDMEAILTNNQASTAGSSTAARTLGGAPAWIESNEERSGTGASGGFSGGVVTTAQDATTTQLQAFTESDLKSVIRQAWTNGGEPTLVLVGPFNKTVASNFAHSVAAGSTSATDFAGRRHNVAAASKVLTASIDVYESDFGRHNIVPNRFQREVDGLVIDPSLWAVSYLRTPRNWPLSKTGDTEKRQILVEYTLECRNEAGSGIVADLTTA